MSLWDSIRRRKVTEESLRSDLRDLPVNLKAKLEGRKRELDHAYEQFRWILGRVDRQLDLEASARSSTWP